MEIPEISGCDDDDGVCVRERKRKKEERGYGRTS